MAEFVNQSVENMLPELEQMERVRLFTKEETRQILKKRQRLEYRLRKRTKVEEDYMRYVEYERNLLALIKKRRRSTGYNFKKKEIDVPIIMRIHRLFQLCQTRFPDSIDAWLQHIEFSKEQKQFSRISLLFTAMLRNMNKKPELWLEAARWEADQSNLDTARSLMTRGLSFNAESRFLWAEYYRMELEATEMIRKGQNILNKDSEQSDDPTVTAAIADIVRRKALEQFPDDMEMLVSLIKVCQKFDFARAALEALVSQLREKFFHEPQTWHMLARRLLPTEKGKVVESVTEEEEERCFTIYQQGVKEAAKAETWTLYLQTCQEVAALPADKSRTQQRIQRTLEVFKTAADQECLSEDMFLQWVGLLTDSLQGQEAEGVCRLAVTRFPASVTLWRALLVLHFSSLRPPATVAACLQDALRHVPEKEAWSLWEPTLEYLAICKYDGLQGLMEKAALTLLPEVCQPAKLFRLRWTFLNLGLEAARPLYKQLSAVKPVPLQFYFEYADMEMAQSAVKMKKVRRAFEDAVIDFGASDPDVWLRYIQAELTCPGGEGLRAGQLHSRATQALVAAALPTFIQRYNASTAATSQSE